MKKPRNKKYIPRPIATAGGLGVIAYSTEGAAPWAA